MNTETKLILHSPDGSAYIFYEVRQFEFRKEKYMPFTFVMQNIAANLGGMLTPFGNPQNLYLYSFFKIPTLEFCKIMLPPFLLAVAMLILCCLFVKAEKLNILLEWVKSLPKRNIEN